MLSSGREKEFEGYSAVEITKKHQENSDTMIKSI
jgi:hypothetical protein